MRRNAPMEIAGTLLLVLGLPATAIAADVHGAPDAEAAPAASVALAIAPAAAVAASPAAEAGHGAAPNWGYAAPEDPSVWAELSDDFRLCGAGQEQSPIDIDQDDLVPSTFEPVGLHWLPFMPSFLNNGHTLQANAYGAGGYAELGGDRYELLQFHFHHQSEHTINGAHAPMEVHFVHRDDSGRLLVLGAMMEEGASNSDIETLWAHIPASGEEVEIETAVDPLSLVPRDHASYRYAGSLTTPPCSEIVTWNVFTHPVTVSSYQITAFGAQYENNARPTQPLHRRFILTDVEH